MSGQQPAPAALHHWEDPVPLVLEAGCAPGMVWTGGIPRPHWNSILDRPSRRSIAIPAELHGPYIKLIINYEKETIIIITTKENTCSDP